jgi:hypothetical protein
MPTDTDLFCFLSEGRQCSADCMAWFPSVPEGSDYRAPDGHPYQWARCMVLVNMHKTGKHLVHIASTMRSLSSSPAPNANEVLRGHGL